VPLRHFKNPRKAASELHLLLMGKLEPKYVTRYFVVRFVRALLRVCRLGLRRPRQYLASWINSAGWISASCVAPRSSGGRSVHDAGTEVRLPEGNWSTTHGSSSRQKMSWTLAYSPPTLRRCLRILTQCPRSS